MLVHSHQGHRQYTGDPILELSRRSRPLPEVLKRLANPELVEEQPELRVVLVVLDAARYQVDSGWIEERDPRRPIHDGPIDSRPLVTGGRWIGRLQPEGRSHHPVDGRVAELRPVRVER